MNRIKLFIRLLFVLGFISVGVVSAREVLTQTDCIIDADTVVEETLFVLCETLEIHGEVRGDVIGATIHGSIDGTIHGNVYLIALELDVSGTLHKDLHFGGGVLAVNPPPDDETPSPDLTLNGGIKSIALSSTIYENTHINGEIISAGYQLLLHGTVARELNFWGSALVIDGTVDADVIAGVGDSDADSSQLETLLIPLNLTIELSNPGLVIQESGQVLGAVQYSVPDAAVIAGDVRDAIVYYPLTRMVALPTLEEPASISLYLAQIMREFTTLIAIGGVGMFFLPSLMRTPMNNLRLRPFASFSVGMLAFILSFPVVLIALILSLLILVILQLIGLNALVVVVGMVLGLTTIGGTSIFYFVAIFVARVLTSLAIGGFVLRTVFRREDNRQRPFLSLIVGVIVMSAIFSLPVIGWLVNAAALFLGLGAILTILLEQVRRFRDSTPPPAPDAYEPSPAITRIRQAFPTVPKIDIQPIPPIDDTLDTPPEPPPPPPLDGSSKHQARGMDNLPDGFDFDFFDDKT